MLTSLIEKGSWIIQHVGMPLVYLYHLILSNVFLSTFAENSTGLEKLGNLTLTPVQFFLDGKKAVWNKEENFYQLQSPFDYKSHFFVKTGISCAVLSPSFWIGVSLKGFAYAFPSTRERAKAIASAAHSTKIFSNQKYYEAIGIEIGDFRKAESISPPKWKRHPGMVNRLEKDLQALQEIIQILSQHEIPFWIDCGSCLGAYQYGGTIPNDWDIDMAVLLPDFENVKNALQKLDPTQYVVQDWSGRDHPHSYLKVFVKASGGMIDIYHFAIDEEKKEIHTLLSNEKNIFIPKSWIIREKRYTTPMPFSFVFPLKKALFEGIEIPVPGRVEDYLSVFYGKNLAPAKVYNELTGCYEKDLTHPYWQLAEAH